MDSGQDGNNVVGSNGFGSGVGSFGSASVGGVGAGSVPVQPITSGSGDIVLNPDNKKSNKGLKWAIGIIVGILVLVGVAVGVWFGVFNNKQQEDVKVEGSGFADKKEELLKLFEVDEELSKYDSDTLISDYVGGDNEVVAKIRLGLGKLDGATSEYVKNYVDENMNFANLAEEIIQIIDEEGCGSKVVAQLNDCLVSSDQGEVFVGKKRELKLSRQRAEYIIEMAKGWLRDFMREEIYYEDGE